MMEAPTLPETLAAGVILLWKARGGGVETLLLRGLETGEWGFPKGHAQVGESPRQNAERELCEETGLSPSDLQYLDFERELRYLAHKHTAPRWKTVRYFAAWIDPQASIVLSAEHDAMARISLADACARLKHQDLKTLIADLAKAVGDP